MALVRVAGAMGGLLQRSIARQMYPLASQQALVQRAMATKRSKKKKERPPMMAVTDAATKRLRSIVESQSDVIGVRVGVKTRGCSGLTYTLDMVKDALPEDEVIPVEEGLSLFIDPKAVMFVLGTKMDFVESELQRSFTFDNPNEKGKCGCGESFNV